MRIGTLGASSAGGDAAWSATPESAWSPEPNQGLGRAVVAGLARAWGEQGIVYLTGRDRQRVEETAAALARDGLHVVPQVCDVRDDGAGLVDTRASRPWFTDMSRAQSPDQAAVDVVELATGPIEPRMYGELVQHGQILPWTA